MAMSVKDAVSARRSTRAFLPNPVPEALLHDVLERATRAPSGGNVQPWRLYVLNGKSMSNFRATMDERLRINPLGEQPEYAVYPPSLGEPYRAWRFEVGEAMYACLGIPRDAKADRLQWLLTDDL